MRGWASADISFRSVTLLKGLKSLLCKLRFALDDKYIAPIGRGRFIPGVILTVREFKSNPRFLRLDKTRFALAR